MAREDRPDPPAPAGRRWLDVVVRIVIATLFVVPAAVLVAGPKPGRFGFQMYSGYGVPSASWTDAAGRTHEVELTELLGNPRPDVAWTEILPPELCERFPDAVRVEVQQVRPGGPEKASRAC